MSSNHGLVDVICLLGQSRNDAGLSQRYRRRNAPNPPRNGEGYHEVVEGVVEAAFYCTMYFRARTAPSVPSCHLPVPGRIYNTSPKHYNDLII
jgi:hypothetical protein